MKRWAGALASWASSTRWMMRARVVSEPTLVARTSSRPPELTVPANTRWPVSFSTGIDSPVMLLSSTAARPATTSPSTGIFAPGRTTTISPGRTSSGATVTSRPSRRTVADSGASSKRWARARRVRPMVARSSAPPRAKRKVTAAPSHNSPMRNAPVTAMVTRASMPMRRMRRSLMARTAMGRPATRVAATSPRSKAGRDQGRARKAAAMRSPLSRGMAHGPRTRWRGDQPDQRERALPDRSGVRVAATRTSGVPRCSRPRPRRR